MEVVAQVIPVECHRSKEKIVLRRKYVGYPHQINVPVFTSFFVIKQAKLATLFTELTYSSILFILQLTCTFSHVVRLENG